MDMSALPEKNNVVLTQDLKRKKDEITMLEHGSKVIKTVVWKG